LQDKSAICRTIETAPGLHAPGHLGELTQIIDFALVDAVLEETGARERRLRLLPARVMVYFVLALAMFEHCSYQAVWAKLTAALAALPLPRPSASSLSRARRRLGAAPLKALFEVLAGPVARPQAPGARWRGWHLVAIDGTTVHTPDHPQVRADYPKRTGRGEFGYPLLRLVALIECGSRALLAATLGPERDGEPTLARRVLGALSPGMLVLADAGYDSGALLAQVHQRGAAFICRSGATRCPTIITRLPDGSYLALLGTGRSGTGHAAQRLPVRIIEAWITLTLSDGSHRREQWRLITDLTDHRRYPAAEVIGLYHRRWQIETTYFSLKATVLQGRVLRSCHPAGLEQEMYALLTVYQALIRLAADAAFTRPDLALCRISFTVLLHAARDQVVLAAAIAPERIELVGVIGRAALGALLPALPRYRLKARTRKNSVSKYSANQIRAPHPAVSQRYRLSVEVMVMEQGLTTRRRT
jgi:hypothetical protein